MPKYIIIFGKKIKIKYCDDMDGLHGEFIFDKMLIRINRMDCQKEQRLTLAHESLHASLAIGGVCELLSPELEEAIVRNIEHGFFPLVSDCNLLEEK